MIIPTFSGNTFRLLLAAAIVVGAVSPPGYGHVHPGGNLGHDHHAGPPMAVSHDSHGHAQPRKVGDTLGTSAAHLHLAILWGDVSLPIPDDGNSDGTKRDAPLCVVRVIDECVPTTVDMRLVLGEAADLQTIVCAAIGRTDRTAELAERSVNRVFLCDTARHERSGVHLI